LLVVLFPSNILAQKEERIAHVDTALSYVGVHEKTGKNDGKEVEKFLKSVGLRKGNSWCAAFVSYCLSAAKVKSPKVRSGLARSFKTKNIILASRVMKGLEIIPKGYLIGWQRGNTINGHIGIVTKLWKGPKGETVEGNTSSNKGSQYDGDGVFQKTRTISEGNYFSIKWFTPVLYEYIVPLRFFNFLNYSTLETISLIL